MSSFKENLEFLEGMAKDAVEAARVKPGERVGDKPANSLGFVLLRPGGRDCYPAIWTQDFCMALESGFISAEEALNHFRLVASVQNGSEPRLLKSGAEIPPHAIPDHILFDGSPVFFPGTYSPGEDQGGEPWGLRPPVNSHYDFIAIAHYLWRSTGDCSFLDEEIKGKTAMERLELAFSVPDACEESGLVSIDASRRAVGFIFCDAIYMTGKHLFASLLRRRAALQLLEMATIVGWNDALCEKLGAVAKSIAKSIPGAFSEKERFGGWLLAATGVGRQPDVWGTIRAIYDDVLPQPRKEAAMQEILKAIAEGTILYKGAMRHVPTNCDASPDSAWERTNIKRNRYQNGAYWHTPTGWLVAILAQRNRELAERIFDEMCESLREGDFRKGPSFDAPLECLGPEPKASNNPLFLASVTTPYGVLKLCRSK